MNVLHHTLVVSLTRFFSLPTLGMLLLQNPPQQLLVNRSLHLRLWHMRSDTLLRLLQPHLFPMEKLPLHPHLILPVQIPPSTRHQWKAF